MVPTKKSRKGRGSSCPPQATWSLESGPWSLEWLSDQHHGDAGVISYPEKLKKVVRPSSHMADTIDKKRKKVNGVLRHYVHSLKKIGQVTM